MAKEKMQKFNITLNYILKKLFSTKVEPTK